MNLKRLVLFEKSMFYRYAHPKDVPQYLWDYAGLIMNKDDNNIKEFFTSYIDIILAPLSGQQDYTIIGPNLNFKKDWCEFVIKWKHNLTLYVGMQIRYLENNDRNEYIKTLTFQMWEEEHRFIIKWQK